MEKGLVKLLNKGYGPSVLRPTPLEWFSEKTIKKYEGFFKSILLKPDLIIHGINPQRAAYSDFLAYHCENCGAILIIPSENDYDRNF